MARSLFTSRRHFGLVIFLVGLITSLSTQHVPADSNGISVGAAPAPLGPMIPVNENLGRLMAEEDTDHDKKITVHDRTVPFAIRNEDGTTLRLLTNVFQLSVLLQELKGADDRQVGKIRLASLPLDQSPAERTHELIKTMYWDALTRRIDAVHLDQVIHDDKVVSKYDCLYVPGADPVAVEYFKALEKTAAAQHRFPPLKVIVLPPPDRMTAAWVRDRDGEHGLLSLKLELDAHGQPIGGAPYVVPGGRFNELYGWDSYFILLGLLQDGRADLARGLVDNLLYEVEYYGKIPNANRTYYLTRSQPPFLTSCIRSVYKTGGTDRRWLVHALKIALAEYQNVWLGPDRLVNAGGFPLSRYYDTGAGPCPEVEPGHYDDQIRPWLAQVKTPSSASPLTPYIFLNRYLYGGEFAGLRVKGRTLDDFFRSDRADRESGHDTTHRFDDRADDYVSVDLNSLLYKYEMDFAELIENEFGGQLADLGGRWSEAAFWRHRAAARRQAMLALMWNDRRGFFFDYDFVHHRQSSYISATGLYPLWAGLLDSKEPEDQKRAERTIAYAREHLEQFAGLAASARESVTAARTHDSRQWDFPYGWAPHQMIAWQGLENYGDAADAERLAYRWLYTIAKDARDYNGTIPEKYDVVTGSHEAFVEYGNVGTKFDYIAPEGFGWTDASFEVGMTLLSPQDQTNLYSLKPPPAK